jgi:predicted PhzF superfamily epimerase YddE/YHI9
MGNPAGVCVLPAAISTSEMQAIARELNQPETAFLLGNGSSYAVRWFSPEVEVKLCGHATLASAQVLWSEGWAARGQEITFTSPHDRLVAKRGEDGAIWLDFPGLPGIPEAPPEDVVATIDRAPIAAARHGDRWLFEFETAQDVRDIKPDFVALRKTGVRSLIVTAPSDIAPYQIISRNFAPIVGVNEDQATGMAHICLAAHWRSRLGDEVLGWQNSKRGGVIIARSRGDRVELGGRACVEMRGEWVA